MLENKIESLPVVKNHKEIVGIITSSDLFRVIEEELPKMEGKSLVRHYMSYEPVTITPDQRPAGSTPDHGLETYPRSASGR